MATQRDIILIQGDDPTVALSVTQNGSAYNLTGQRVEVLVKATKTTADASALYTLSSSTSGVTIVSAVGGTATADFTDRVATAGKYWYRAYVASTSGSSVNRMTFAYGTLTVQAA